MCIKFLKHLSITEESTSKKEWITKVDDRLRVNLKGWRIVCEVMSSVNSWWFMIRLTAQKNIDSISFCKWEYFSKCTFSLFSHWLCNWRWYFLSFHEKQNFLFKLSFYKPMRFCFHLIYAGNFFTISPRDNAALCCMLCFLHSVSRTASAMTKAH